MKTFYFLLILSYFLSSCASQDIEDYRGKTPKLDLREFFQGKIIAKGMVQSRSGEVIKRFVVDMFPKWEGQRLVLDEKFRYADGSESTRIWKIDLLNDGFVKGEAADVVGPANGRVLGNAFYFNYTLDVPVDDTNYHINIDDWMYLIDEDTLVAKSEMTKWGFKVGEITLMMWKEK